jgi:hypothetical protein
MDLDDMLSEIRALSLTKLTARFTISIPSQLHKWAPLRNGRKFTRPSDEVGHNPRHSFPLVTEGLVTRLGAPSL